MAIQQIEQSNFVGDTKKGITRQIDSGAQKLILDTIQITQYTKPEESIVRELTSNAVDSQSEKEKAIEILSGISKVEDYFIEREGELYKDSKWDASYYDLNYLDVVNNRIKLTYNEGTGSEFWSDTFSIKDYGVGLGGSRLEGVFSIGFSTKRNRKDVLGSFGFGAKVGLANRCDYYITKTVYNGKRFEFKCYSYQINSIIGKFCATGESNKSIKLFEGTNNELEVYYEETDEKNSTEIIVPCKKNHRTKFLHAVQSQLLYFSNVDFFIKREDERIEEIDFRAKIIYNSKNIILSDNRQFGKPHIIVIKGGDEIENQKGTCYGYIDFKELELEDLNGNIGIKCPIRSSILNPDGTETVLHEGISVLPSRESVIWDDNTRNFIKKRFQEVTEEASEIVSKDLIEEDFLLWLKKCQEVMLYNNSTSSVIGRLAKVIDKQSIKPVFNKDRSIKFETFDNFFFGFEVRQVTSKIEFKANKKKQVITRNDLHSFSNFNLGNGKLYFYENNAENFKDKFLLSKDDHSVYQIRVSPNLERIIEVRAADERIKDVETYRLEVLERVEKIKSYIFKSSLFVDYSKIEIPEDFKTNSEEEDKEFDEIVVQESLTPLERRKLEEKVVYSYYLFTPHRQDDSNKKYTLCSEEERIEDLNNYTGRIYYGAAEDEEKLVLATMIAFKFKHSISQDYKIIKISKSNLKHFKQFNHIDKFFMEITTDNILKIDDKFITWNTARLISKVWKDFHFLENFGIFNSEIYDIYKELYKYCENYDVDLTSYHNKKTYPFGNENFIKDFDYFIDKVTDLQIFLEENKDPNSLIAELDKIEGLPNTVKEIKAVDITVYYKLQELINYVSPIKDLLNEIPLLTNSSSIITKEVESLIRDFLNSKNVKMC